MEYKDFLQEFADRRGLLEFEGGVWQRTTKTPDEKRAEKEAARKKKESSASYKAKQAAMKAGAKTFDVGYKGLKKGLGYVRKHKKAAAGVALGAYAAHRLLRKKCAKRHPPHLEPASYKRCMSRLGREG